MSHFTRRLYFHEPKASENTAYSSPYSTLTHVISIIYTVNQEIFIQDFFFVFVIFMVFNFSRNLNVINAFSSLFFCGSNENYMTLKIS